MRQASRIVQKQRLIETANKKPPATVPGLRLDNLRTISAQNLKNKHCRSYAVGNEPLQLGILLLELSQPFHRRWHLICIFLPPVIERGV